MTETAVEQLWKNYQDAWADISITERERLLQASVSPDVVFTSPGANGRGMSDLAVHIADFQREFPGAYFKSTSLIMQNQQVLAEWTMLHRDGSDSLTGHSYAKLNDQGELIHLAGFWKQSVRLA